jgi:hypothetical protein
MLGMIVADHAGYIEGSAWWLVHKQWNGITLLIWFSLHFSSL